MSWLRKGLEEKRRFFRVASSRKNNTLIQISSHQQNMAI